MIFFLFVFVALRPKSTAMAMAGQSVHLTTLFHGQAWTSTSEDLDGDRGSGPPPWKITSYMGFYREYAIGPPPPWKSWTPMENVGPPLEPWKMIVFFEINHLTSVISWGLKKKKKHAWLQTEGPRVRASPASLRCGPWASHIYPSLVLVQPRKTRTCLTERLLMGHKESNQIKKTRQSFFVRLTWIPLTKIPGSRMKQLASTCCTYFRLLLTTLLLKWFSGREEKYHRNYFMINLHESMGLGRDRTRNPWICSQTRICCQTRYRLRYEARSIVDDTRYTTHNWRWTSNDHSHHEPMAQVS